MSQEMSLLSSAKDGVETLKENLGEEVYAVLGHVTLAPPQSPSCSLALWISYELLNP